MDQSYDTFRGQAEHMASFTHIRLSPLQKDLYATLKEPLNRRSDQQILAEVLKQTDPTCLCVFMMAYKHIFLAELKALNIG